MTSKADFSEEEWDLVAEGPVVAGMIVLTAQSGGSFRETWAMSKSYAEARRHHGESQLLDELVSSRPEYDRHRFKTPEALREVGLQRIGEAATLLGTKATPEELGVYREFVVGLAERVAAAHREDGQAVSPAEQEAIAAIRAEVGSGAP
jgi:hypothetical protein